MTLGNLLKFSECLLEPPMPFFKERITFFLVQFYFSPLRFCIYYEIFGIYKRI